MTRIHTALDENPISDSSDLPQPDRLVQVSGEEASSTKSARRLPDVKDAGRISFGASCRIPLRK